MKVDATAAAAADDDDDDDDDDDVVQQRHATVPRAWSLLQYESTGTDLASRSDIPVS